MILNHINLPVADVAATRDFFTRYFGMKVAFELPKNMLAMLRDDGGMVLNLSHFDKDKTAEISYHRDLHVGFLVESREEVDAMHARMTADSLVVEAPRRLQGRYGFYYPAPGGFEVEVAHMEQLARPSAGAKPAEPAADLPDERR